jgi:DinB superfamily
MKLPKGRALTRSGSPEIALLLRLLEEGYQKKAWHGPNLKGSIRGLSAAQAGWRPRPDRHSIAENVVHAAYWKYAVRRRLNDEKRRSFALDGSNWFALPSPLDEDTWKMYGRLLEQEHRLLRDVVASFPVERLYLFPQGGKVNFANQIYGIAMHDVYHAGQIQLLKRLQLPDSPR